MGIGEIHCMACEMVDRQEIKTRNKEDFFRAAGSNYWDRCLGPPKRFTILMIWTREASEYGIFG